MQIYRPEKLSGIKNVKDREPQSIHCMELMTGKNLTGFFTLRDDHIGAMIYSYNGLINIEGETPIILCTEDNDIVSLYSNFVGSGGHSYRLKPPTRECFRQKIISNTAIVGYDAWTNEDRVKRVVFEVMHSNHLLKNRNKFDKIGSSKHPGTDSLCVYKDRAGGLQIEAYYSATYGVDFDAPKSIWPIFSITFDEARTVHEYIKPVLNYYGFISFCLGAFLPPSNFHIDRMSIDEIATAIETDSYPGDHKVHYVWPKADVNPDDLWIGGSPVIAWEDDELEAFRACLVVWMERASDWRKAYALMEACLKGRKEISPQRLINACRWFEEIPLTVSEQAISNDDVNAIANAASQVAKDRGISEKITYRIKGSIKWLKEETREQRFQRLVKMIQIKFGPKCLPDIAVPDLVRAFELRGKTAHGHYDPDSDAEFNAFVKSIAALEALCALLTAYALPINDKGIKRMRNNPLVKDYLLMTRSK